MLSTQDFISSIGVSVNGPRCHRTYSEKSRQDILDHLGFKHTFSVECPYGTENERAVHAALLRYQVARNYMPDAEVDDLDRWNKMDPAASRKAFKISPNTFVSASTVRLSPTETANKSVTATKSRSYYAAILPI